MSRVRILEIGYNFFKQIRKKKTIEKKDKTIVNDKQKMTKKRKKNYIRQPEIGEI